MSAPAGLRRGWCPTALRPMASGDGLLLRLAMPGGMLSAATARGIADCARRFGNGFVDLTRRANLQLRGVRDATLPTLLARLDALGLVPPGGEPETARAIVASPLAGLDPEAALDIRPVVAALRARLAAEPVLAALPAKFCWLIDDGGRWPLDDVAADIRFVAARRTTKAGANEPRFSIALGGRAGEADVIGVCAAPDIPEVAVVLAYAFLALAGTRADAPRRMRDLVARMGAGIIAETVRAALPLPLRERVALAQQEPGEGAEGRDVPPLPSSADADDTLSPKGRGRAPLIGFHDLGNGTGAVGVGAPFGRLAAGQLDALAEAAEGGLGELRLTPWRAVLLPCAAARAQAMRGALAEAGLITDAADARLAVVACPGAPSCASAATRTREDAAALAPLARRLGAGVTLHVSGCAKGCARSDAARATLVGRDGLYDLVVDGTAGDAPVIAGLTRDGAAAALARLALAGAVR